MNEVKILNSSDKFAHASVGSLHDFEGKLFMKEALCSSSCEISFGTLQPVRYETSCRDSLENGQCLFFAFLQRTKPSASTP